MQRWILQEGRGGRAAEPVPELCCDGRHVHEHFWGSDGVLFLHESGGRQRVLPEAGGGRVRRQDQRVSLVCLWFYSRGMLEYD